VLMKTRRLQFHEEEAPTQYLSEQQPPQVQPKPFTAHKQPQVAPAPKVEALPEHVQQVATEAHRNTPEHKQQKPLVGFRPKANQQHGHKNGSTQANPKPTPAAPLVIELSAGNPPQLTAATKSAAAQSKNVLNGARLQLAKAPLKGNIGAGYVQNGKPLNGQQNGQPKSETGKRNLLMMQPKQVPTTADNPLTANGSAPSTAEDEVHAFAQALRQKLRRESEKPEPPDLDEQMERFVLRFTKEVKDFMK